MLEENAHSIQKQIDNQELSYNQAFDKYYNENST